MRIREGPQLRVKDLDFDHVTINVREGKASKDRALLLPEMFVPSYLHLLRATLLNGNILWISGC